MELSHYLFALFGGVLIGFAALFMLLFNGRILGVSGILGGLFGTTSRRELWRWCFILGIFFGGILLQLVMPSALENSLNRTPLALVFAGLLVGWGTRLGSGCTSGHGICGVSRLSPRSLLATLIFMVVAILTVWIFKILNGGSL
jgi:uncharacterized membrane protein YedE/YeeE